MRRAAIGLLLSLSLGAPEATASGSSQAQAETAHLRVTAESVRMIFSDPEDESAFHRDWRAEHQPIVDAAAQRAEAALASSPGGLALAAWDAALPEAWAWAEPDHAMSPEAVCAAGPCRCRVQVPGFMMHVEVALAAAPARDALATLPALFAEALATPEEAE